MARIELEHDPFDPSHLGDPQAGEKILNHLDLVQRELDRVDAALNEMREGESRQRSGLATLAQQLQLVGCLEQDLVRRRLPQCPALRIHRLYAPAFLVSGDSYLVSRLDDQQLAVNLADATGHGLAAALLSVFVNRVLEAQLVSPADRQPSPPDRLLQSLNQALIEEQLPDCEFATALHAIYDEASRMLTWARGGVPYPILVRRGQPAVQLVSQGGLLGAFEEQQFEVCSVVLEPGDLFVVYSDGLEALLLRDQQGGGGGRLLDTPWCGDLGKRSASRQLKRIERLLEVTPDDDWPVDDITVLILEALDR